MKERLLLVLVGFLQIVGQSTPAQILSGEEFSVQAGLDTGLPLPPALRISASLAEGDTDRTGRRGPTLVIQ